MKKISIKISFMLVFLLMFSTSAFAQNDTETGDIEELLLELQQENIIEPYSKVNPSLKNTNFSGSLVKVHGISYPGHINTNKQRKHIPDSPEYEQGKSIFNGTVDDATNLFYELAGNGTKINDYKERISTSDYLGIYVQQDGTAYLTRNATIHYSNTGAHIVPAAPLK